MKESINILGLSIRRKERCYRSLRILDEKYVCRAGRMGCSLKNNPFTDYQIRLRWTFPSNR
ncbi:hypothetical protein [Candidatus Pristimantibacillus sp. PTI5]|uniref:hypothetical protein n=1 Tax=Candidatus Pristimantibacillus sp. PTI5 TaxID=3400422 RepID=UPI003B019E0C